MFEPMRNLPMTRPFSVVLISISELRKPLRLMWFAISIPFDGPQLRRLVLGIKTTPFKCPEPVVKPEMWTPAGVGAPVEEEIFE